MDTDSQEWAWYEHKRCRRLFDLLSELFGLPTDGGRYRTYLLEVTRAGPFVEAATVAHSLGISPARVRTWRARQEGFRQSEAACHFAEDFPRSPGGHLSPVQQSRFEELLPGWPTRYDDPPNWAMHDGPDRKEWGVLSEWEVEPKLAMADEHFLCQPRCTEPHATEDGPEPFVSSQPMRERI